MSHGRWDLESLLSILRQEHHNHFFLELITAKQLGASQPYFLRAHHRKAAQRPPTRKRCESCL
eukprot:6187129-Pleurochrysis_carterae.AAC.1